jgi:glycosyltransferase involved in cell wall biosynthesis
VIKVFHLITSSARSSYLRAIVDHADRKRFEVIVGTITPEGPLHEDMKARGVRAVALGCRRRVSYPAGVVQLARWLRQEKIDVLQTHCYDASALGALAGRLARIPVIACTIHHSHELSLQRKLQRKRKHFLADCLVNRWLCHWVISPSYCITQLLVTEERVPEEKVVVIPYGYDFSKLQASKGARERIRKELALDERSFVLGTVGRLFWVKNHTALLKAFARLSEGWKNIILLIVGDGPERASLESQTRQLGIAEQVLFTGYRSDVFDVMAAMDVLVHPSLGEAFCQALSEGAALEKPIVTTDVGGAREVVEDKVSGLLVPPGDVDALYQGLQSMLAGSSGWAEMGKLAGRRMQQFTAERMVAAYEEQYLRWLR